MAGSRTFSTLAHELPHEQGCQVAKADFQLWIFLPPAPKCWDYMLMLSFLADLSCL